MEKHNSVTNYVFAYFAFCIHFSVESSPISDNAAGGAVSQLCGVSRSLILWQPIGFGVSKFHNVQHLLLLLFPLLLTLLLLSFAFGYIITNVVNT